MADTLLTGLSANDALVGTELFYADGKVATAAADAKVTALQNRTFGRKYATAASGSFPAAASLTITGLGGYDDLVFALIGASHNSVTNQALQIQFSSDGASFSTAFSLSNSRASTILLDCNMFFMNCKSGVFGGLGCLAGTQVSTPSIPSGIQSSGILMANLAASLSDIKLVWASGASFDAGTYILSGR